MGARTPAPRPFRTADVSKRRPEGWKSASLDTWPSVITEATFTANDFQRFITVSLGKLRVSFGESHPIKNRSARLLLKELVGRRSFPTFHDRTFLLF